MESKSGGFLCHEKKVPAMILQVVVSNYCLVCIMKSLQQNITLDRQQFSYPLSDFVHFMVQKVAVLIKVLIAEQPLPYHLVWHLASVVHHQLQHVVVGFARKHDSTGVQFIDSTTN